MAFRWKLSDEKYRRVSSLHFVSIERAKSSVNITLIFEFRCKFSVHSSNGEVEAILVGEIVYRDDIRLNDRSAVQRFASYRNTAVDVKNDPRDKDCRRYKSTRENQKTAVIRGRIGEAIKNPWNYVIGPR